MGFDKLISAEGLIIYVKTFSDMYLLYDNNESFDIEYPLAAVDNVTLVANAAGIKKFVSDYCMRMWGEVYTFEDFMEGESYELKQLPALLRELVEESLSPNEFDVMAALLELVGMNVMYYDSRGYSQGDWADVLIIDTKSKYNNEFINGVRDLVDTYLWESDFDA